MTSAPSIAIELSAPVPLVRDLLEWVLARPRTYGETMEAWRTSCPRLPVWEDAMENGLVAVVAGDAAGDGVAQVTVDVTAKGRAWLDVRVREHRTG
jgi:hypothetical protein